MKNLTKIIAFVAIAALAMFAAISCSPEVEVTDYDWSANVQYDPNVNTNVFNTDRLPNAPVFVEDTEVIGTAPAPTVHKDIVLSITFPADVDVLRESEPNIEAGLKKFLTFQTIQRAAPATLPAFGNVDTLSDPIPYTYVRRDQSTVYVKLTKEYSTVDTIPQSQIVAKIDSAQYTFARGLKVDRDSNGIAGEAGYDDWYGEVNGTAYGNTEYASAQFKQAESGWYFTVSSLSTPAWTATSATSTPADITAAQLFTTITPGTTEADNFINGIKSAFGTSFELQEYNGSAWTSYKTSALNGTTNVIEFAQVALKHLTPYRIVWKGTAEPKTAEYLGLQQRIDIRGRYNQNGEDRAYWRGQTEIAGSKGHVFSNPDIKSFNGSTTAGNNQPFVYSSDHEGKNVVIELNVDLKQDTTDPLATKYYGLKELALADFKNSFKIVYAPASSAPLADDHAQITGRFSAVNGLVYVDIKGVEFVKKGSTAIEKGVFDTIRVTLDPAYTKTTGANDYTYILVNNGLGYSDDISVFGSLANWDVDFFEQFELSGIF